MCIRDSFKTSSSIITDRAVAQYRGARNQKPGGRNLCGGMVQLHPAHIMVGVVLHTLCEDGHSRRPVASPPSSRPPCSPHRPSPASISIAASRRRASPDRAHTRAHDYARYERRASRLWSPSSFSVSRAPASAGQRLNDPSSARLPDIIGQTSPPGP